MAAPFVCDFADRRLLIQQPGVTLNGIDFVEVLDLAAPAGTPRQQTLVVRLFRAVPAGFDATRVRIEGGVRVTPVRVVWAQPALSVTAPGVSPAEAAVYAALPEAARTVIVRTDSSGDFSTYRLVIVAVAGDFDPVLSAIELSFKAECPTAFDCGDTRACPPTVATAPAIDYLAKDFSSLRRIMLDRLAVLAPGWTERNIADVGVALVELVAYRADQLSYYQDAVATEAYLGTARKRISVRRHAQLVGYAMHEGTNARTWVQLTASADDVVVGRADPVRFATRCDAPATIAPAAFQTVLDRSKPEVFEPLHDVALYTAHNQIDFYTWGERACCLPVGATRATLIDGTDRLRLRAGDVVIFEAVRGAASGDPVDADVTRRCAVRLTRVTPEASVGGDGITRTPGAQVVDPLTRVGHVEIEWHADDALRFPLCVSSTDAGGHPVDAISVARGNIVLVDHGRTIEPRPLPPAPADARAYRPRLRDADVVHAAPYDASGSANAALAQDPHRAIAAVDVREPTAAWSVRPTLLDSSRFDRDLVVEIDDKRRAHLRFGDGVLGRQPAEGTPLTVRYRVGDALAGNVGAEAIGHLVTASTAITSVRNPLPAVGGLAPQMLEEVRRAAPQAFRTQERAVTTADYAAIAERHPEVQKAVATRRWTGSWYTMFVTIDRAGGKPIDAAFADDLRRFIETFRLAGHDLEITPPRLVPLDIALAVCIEPGQRAAHVLRALLDRFSTRVLADGTTGMFHPDRWTFGQPVYASQIIAAAMNVPGVAWVDMTNPATRFRRWGEPDNGELARGVIAMSRLEIAQLDNSVDAPENGRFAISFLGALS